MKFFVDTADVSEIRALAEAGLVDGVTTNPSLVAKSGRRMADVIAEICSITPGPVSAGRGGSAAVAFPPPARRWSGMDPPTRIPRSRKRAASIRASSAV